jgi:hypothetical protein
MALWKITDAQRAAIIAIRAGAPYAGLSKTGEISRRRKTIATLIEEGLVSSMPQDTDTVTAILTVNEPTVARCERTWGHAVRPLDAHEHAQVERHHGRVTEHSPPGGYTTCTGSKCPHKAKFVTLYSYVTGRRGRTSCAERLVCEDHAKRFRTKYGIATDAPDAPNVGAERRELMANVLQAVHEMTDTKH